MTWSPVLCILLESCKMFYFLFGSWYSSFCWANGIKKLAIPNTVSYGNTTFHAFYHNSKSSTYPWCQTNYCDYIKTPSIPLKFVVFKNRFTEFHIVLTMTCTEERYKSNHCKISDHHKTYRSRKCTNKNFDL